MSEIKLSVNGQIVVVKPGTPVAVAVALAGYPGYRHSVKGQPLGPLCGMGICYECRVIIDGEAHRLSCQTPCEDGMQVVTT